MANDKMIPLFFASVILGVVLGWTIGQGTDVLSTIAVSTESPAWITAFGTIAAVIVALGFGVVTHRREIQIKRKEQADRLNRASALAVAFDHELHMACSMAKFIRENINDDCIRADIHELVDLVNLGLQKIVLPLLDSSSSSLSDFSPQVGASLLVVISRCRQMQHNGPVPFGSDIPKDITERSLRSMGQLLDTWIHDIARARKGIQRYHQRIADIEVRPVDLDSIFRKKD